MAIVLGNQTNPIPLSWNFADWNKEVQKRALKRLQKSGRMVSLTTIAPGGAYAKAIVRGVGLFLGAAAGVELIGLVRDLVDPRPATKEAEEVVERWLKERYGDVLSPRIGPRIKSNGRAPKDAPQQRKIPFPYVDAERALRDVFPAPKRTKKGTEEGEDPSDEDGQEWLERRFKESIVKLQRL